MLLLSFILSLLIGSSIDALTTELTLKGSISYTPSFTSLPVPTSVIIYPSAPQDLIYNKSLTLIKNENVSLEEL